jgi:hypothetical protein
MKTLLATTALVLAAGTADAATRYAGPWGYPTIQAAVDASQAGDTVQLYPKTWYESVRVTRSIVIETHPGFEGTASIVGSSNGAIHVDAHNGEAVTLRSLYLYGQAGPVVKGPTWISNYNAPRISMNWVGLANGTVGVSGFAKLYMTGSFVRNTSSHGISIYGGADLSNVTVENPGGMGIYVYTFNVGTITNRIRRTTIINAGDTGILINGARSGSFHIDDVEVERATKVGIFLENADGTQIDHAVVERTRTNDDGSHGDAVFIRDSEGVDITTLFAADNARSGIAVFGTSIVWLAESQLVANVFDANIEDGGDIEDRGGNTCWADWTTERVCYAQSSTIPTPMPITLPPGLAARQ